MKKLLALFLVFTATLVLASCKKDTTDPDPEAVTIRFACWRDCGSVATQERYPMYHAIKEFELQNPGVTVEILRAPMVPNDDQTGTVEQPWHDYLASLAAVGEFPDLFNSFNMPSALMLGWPRDITTLAQADADFNNIYEDIRESGAFEGHYFAVAYMYEFFGYFINKSLFDNANEDYPTFGFTMDEMLDASKAVARLQEGGNSILGMSGPAELFNYYPAQLNNDLGWYAWNAATQTFDITGPEFEQAITLNLQIANDKSHVNDALTPEERAMYFGTNDWWYPWWNGQMGLHFDFSIMMSFLINAREQGDISFDFDFIGIPRGSKDNIVRTPIKPTYMMLGRNTDNPQEAYDLLKWLSFSVEGYSFRMETSRTVDNVFPIISPPLTNDAAAHTAFFDDTYPNFPEWRQVIENGNFYFDAWAVQPGFIAARWEMLYQEGITMATINHQIGNLGTENIGDHAVEMKRLMDAHITDVYATLRDILGID